jgi:CRISPR-associated exonuclease Cas4
MVVDCNKMYTDDDLLAISALQHLAYCERQWGLIHLEQVWVENSLTAQGRVLHERTHEAESESRGDLRTARGLRIHSFRLGLTGQADVVEFYRVTAEEKASYRQDAISPREKPEAIRLEGVAGLWRPVVVEYKRGKPKVDRCDEIQVCAQAMCLEEMWSVSIPAGAIFYGRPRRRYPVGFTAELRRQTEETARRLHEMTAIGKTPPPPSEGDKRCKKCKRCSLAPLCLPEVSGRRSSVGRYLNQSINEALAGPKE